MNKHNNWIEELRLKKLPKMKAKKGSSKPLWATFQNLHEMEWVIQTNLSNRNIKQGTKSCSA